MVRAAVVNHPSEWSFGGYNEIQSPRHKCALITYEKLGVLAGYQNYNSLRESDIELVNDSLANSNNVRDSRWTRSIVVGSEQFLERIKAGLGIKALGRKIRDAHGGYELREGVASYITGFYRKKGDIVPENTYK